MRKKVSVLINIEILEKAHKLGLNASKILENQLQTLIQAIEATNNTNDPSLGSASLGREGECGRRDLNPGRQRGRLEDGTIDWDGFDEFCRGRGRVRGAKQLVSYGMRYHQCLLKRDFSDIQKLSDTMRPNAMKGLSALSKYLGCYDDFKQLVKDSDLKWGGKSADDIFIDRLTSVEDPEEIWAWIREVKKVRPELTDFMDLMALSGLRLIEAFNSFNQIGALSRSEGIELVLSNNGKTRVSGYFNSEKSSLEHFWFREMFIRKSKKAFVSFVPGELVQAIAKQEPWVSTDAVQKMVQKRGLQLRFADIREAHATFMTKFLKREEIDFLHGRVTSGVFMQHYFNPALIADLKTRTFQGINEILQKVKA